MTIQLTSDWEQLLSQKAAAQGTTPEALVLAALRDKYAPEQTAPAPPDQWEALVRSIGRDCSVSLSHEEVSRERVYD
jgi:hypothetical protein